MKNREYAIVGFFIIITILIISLAMLSTRVALFASIATAGTILFFTKPFHGLLLYVILLYVRPQDFMPGLQKLRIMLVIAVVIIVSFSIHKVFNRRKILAVSPRQSALLLLLLLIVPLSNITNAQFKLAGDGFNEFLTLFLLFIMIINLVEDARKLRMLCWTLVICTFLLCVNGIIQHWRGYDLIGTEPTLDGRIQWIGIFGDPNDLALLINSFFPFVLVNIFKADFPRTGKWALALIGTANLTALYYTNSRGGFIAFIIMLVFFAYRHWGLMRGMAIAAFILVAATFIAPSRMAVLSPYEQSASGRVFAWIDGLVMLKSRPIMGIGYQNFTELHGRAAHSAFIQCMAELGLVGYFVWLALLYTGFSDISVAGRKAPANGIGAYAKIFQLSIVGFLGSAFFLSQAYSPVLYLILGLTVAAARTTESGASRPALLSMRELITISILLGASIVAYKGLAAVYI